jgi:23S rRNA A2030 N6-methylase RlmJ
VPLALNQLSDSLAGGDVRRISLLQRDSVALPRMLPPPTAHGLTFFDLGTHFDSNYWDRVGELLNEAYQRYPMGMYAVAYPIHDALPYVACLIHRPSSASPPLAICPVAVHCADHATTALL